MLRLLPPLAVLGIAFAICYYLFSSQPEPFKMPQRESFPKVQVQALENQSYQVLLSTQGTVQARTESTLISEVRGRINSISPAFRTGGFFEKGELLIKIDERDYATAVIVAEAALAQAELAMSEEQARANQAKIDWERINQNEEPSDLVLRLPQIKQAEANVASAQARLDGAKLNLERTKILAPYAGRILAKRADIGQYVSTGTTLANIYAVDYAEIRLPLNERQLAFVNIPEAYRGSRSDSKESHAVDLITTVGNRSFNWRGQIMRAEGSFDTKSRQLFVVAQVDDPYAEQADGRPPLKVGSFVQAVIKGSLLENVFVIPRELYRKNEYVVIVDEENKLRRRPLDVIWSDQENLVVRDGLKEGENICLTPLRFPSEGMRVELISDSPSEKPKPSKASYPSKSDS